MRNPVRVFRERWAQASLEYDLAHGRRPYGRTDLSGSGSPLSEVTVPMLSSIEAVVIRADGSREDLGVISETAGVVTGEQLVRLHAAARRAKR